MNSLTSSYKQFFMQSTFSISDELHRPILICINLFMDNILYFSTENFLTKVAHIYLHRWIVSAAFCDMQLAKKIMSNSSVQKHLQPNIQNNDFDCKFLWKGYGFKAKKLQGFPITYIGSWRLVTKPLVGVLRQMHNIKSKSLLDRNSSLTLLCPIFNY